MASTTVYSKSGDTMKILPGDVSYWENQGWSTTKDSKEATKRGINEPNELFKLRPSQYKKIVKDNKISARNFDEFFIRKGNDIYLRPEANITEKGTNEGGRISETDKEETEIDPYKVAAKYGYTKEDFAYDLGFYDYWKNKNSLELENALARRSDWNRTDKGKKTEEDNEKDTSIEKYIQDLIDSGEINENQGSIMLEILGNDEYTSGLKILSDEEIAKVVSDAEVNATTDLSPHYEKMTQEELEDLKASYADIRGEGLRYQQKEEMDYASLLKNTKQNLRARGQTFSGESRKTLGAESALREDLGIEGEVPTARRFKWEDKSAEWQQRARDLGTDAERRLGSAGLAGEKDYLKPGGLVDPYGMGQGRTYGTEYKRSQTAPIYTPHKKEHREYVKYGDISLDKKKEIEASKWDRVSRYKIDPPRLSSYKY